LSYGQDNGTSAGTETYKFTGNSYSSANGLYYEFQRWYDNSTGRFISEDPLPGHLRIPQSLNAFAYVLNQPTRLVDPSGLSWKCFGQEDCGGGGASGAGLGSTGSNTITGNDVPSIDVSSNDLSTNTITPEQASQNIANGEIPSEGAEITKTGYKFVSTPDGNLVRVPEKWDFRLANNGQGSVYQEPGALGNVNMIRIMDPTARYPQGYVVYYNDVGQPLDVYGSVSSGPATTHIPIDYKGPIPGWP